MFIGLILMISCIIGIASAELHFKHGGYNCKLQPEIFEGKYLNLVWPYDCDHYSVFSLIGDFEGFVKKRLGDTDYSVAISVDMRGHFFNGRPPPWRPIKLGLGKVVDTVCDYSEPLLTSFFRSLASQLNLYKEKGALRVGLFPYEIGRGLVLGNAHLIMHPLPGLYDDYHIDQYRPGIALKIKPFEAIDIDLYYGFLAKHSIDFKTNYAYERAQEMCSQSFLGADIKNNVIHGALTTELYKNFTAQTYLMFRSDTACMIEVPYDTHFSLTNIGFSIQGEYKRCVLYVEGALQRGTQFVKAIDRNMCETLGFIQQSHLFNRQTLPNPERFVWQAARLQTFPEDLGRCKAAGAEFENEDGTEGSKPDIYYKNSYNRFRKAYVNKIDARAFYGELSVQWYKNDSWDVMTAVGLGYLSGDDRPNDSVEKIMLNRLNNKQIYSDCDKKYHGFIGTEQMFNSPYIKPYFLHFLPHISHGLIYSQSPCTDISNRVFGGFSFSFFSCNKNFSLQFISNVIAYGLAKKIERGYSYPLQLLYLMNSDAQQVTDSCLSLIESQAHFYPSRYLGSEFNIEASLKYDALAFFARGALFSPGSFYAGLQGNFLPLSMQRMLAANDFSGIENKSVPYVYKSPYAFFLNIGFSVSI